MNIPEYHVFFSNQGPINVHVKFKDSDKFIPNKKMTPVEINNLISTEKNEFLTQMTFDDHQYEIYKYEINPLKNVLTIFVRIAS